MSEPSAPNQQRQRGQRIRTPRLERKRSQLARHITHFEEAGTVAVTEGNQLIADLFTENKSQAETIERLSTEVREIANKTTEEYTAKIEDITRERAEALAQFAVAHQAAEEMMTRMFSAYEESAGLKLDNEALRRRIQDKTNRLNTLQHVACSLCWSHEIDFLLGCGHFFCQACIKIMHTASGTADWEQVNLLTCGYCRQITSKDRAQRCFLNGCVISGKEVEEVRNAEEVGDAEVREENGADGQ